ncbi:MAG: CBS domain-containing protein [Asgard group archaeon]|nr:CBS domain-containing protein [Asgard group archaeon]
MTSNQDDSSKNNDKSVDSEKSTDYIIDEDDESLEDDQKISTYLGRSWKNTKREIKNGWRVFVDDIKHPKKAIRDLYRSKSFITNSLAIVVGLIGAVSALGFEWLNEGSRILFMEKLFPTMSDSFGSWKFIAILITPLIASIITAPFIWKINPESKGSGIPNVMESIVLHDGRMQHRTPFVKMISSAICSGGGLSVGREGPITQVGAGFSSGIARLVGLHGRNMRIVVISGLSAAIAATFNSPIGGALFGIEILLVSLVADEIVPVVIASLTSSTFSALFDITEIAPNSNGLPEPSFNVDALRNLDWNSFIHHIHWFLLFGILAGLIGVFYAKFFHLIRGIFKRISMSGFLIPILGALLTGAIAIASPKEATGIPMIFGSSYSTIANILNDNQSALISNNSFNSILSLLIVVMLLKIVATSFSVGSGNPGGIFAPALLIGACSGSFFAEAINSLPNINVNVSVFALTGLAAVFAGSTRAPLTMIFMGAEMTGNIKLMIPLMLTCSISYLVCRGFLKESIYTQSLADKGLKIYLGGHITILSSTKVEEIMVKDVIYVHSDSTVKEASEKIKETGHFGFPIVTGNSYLEGMITIATIRKLQLEGKIDDHVIKHAAPNLVVLTIEQSVDEALELLFKNDCQRAPVVTTLDDMKLVGILSKTDILRSFEVEKIRRIEEQI